MIVLVLNCGSSSLKFQVIDAEPDAMADGQARRLARGSIERIAGAIAREGRISMETARVQVWVSPTDEEMVIAQDAIARLAHGLPEGDTRA